MGRKGRPTAAPLPQLVLAAKWTAIGKALPSVIHELNNALNTVIGFADLWQGDERLPKELRADLKDIVQAGLHARHLLETLRNAVQASVTEPVWEQVVLSEVCERALALVATPLRRFRIQVHRDYRPETPPAYASAGMVLLLTLCLLHNACEALAAKGGTLTVRTYGADGAAVLEVEDDGDGIAPSVQGHLFEPFATTKPTGTGLGLFLADYLARQLQGQLHLASPTGRGTVVTLRLKTAPQT